MELRKFSFPVLKAARWASFTKGETEAYFENWVLWIRAGDLPVNLPLDPNARNPDTDNRVARAIANTLREEPGEFVKRNNGMCLVASRCAVKDNVATIELRTFDLAQEQDEGHRGDGVLNGGHTYAVICQVLAEGDSEQTAHAAEAVVRVEIQTGISEDTLADISRARNQSTPVKEFSLKNLAKEWDGIKQALPPAIRSNVAFMENDPEAPDAEYDVGDLVKLLGLFDNRSYPIKDKDPIAAFTSEKSLLVRWKSENFEHLFRHVPTLLKLHDDVAIRFSEALNKPGRLFDGVEKADPNKPFRLLGGGTSKHKISAALLFPLLAALRVFLAEDSSRWVISPKELCEPDGIVDSLIKNVKDMYRENGRSSQAHFGRNKSNWENLRKNARIVLLERQASLRETA